MYNLGQYIAGNTPIHRLDPRVKVISLIVFSSLVLMSTLPETLLLSAALAGAILISCLTWHQVIDALKPLFILMLLLFTVHLLFTEGKPLLALPFVFFITEEGLLRGAMIVWQFSCLILSAAILTMTTSPSALINGIEKLLRPLNRLGIPSYDVAMMVSMALRFVPTFLEEFDRIRTAQMARGADLGTGSMMRRAQAASLMALPLVISAFRRADELVEAMEARGYQRGPRTFLTDLQMTGNDYITLLILGLFSLVLVIGRNV